MADGVEGSSSPHPGPGRGYRALTLAADAPLGKSGARFRGHEFHFAGVVREAKDAPLFEVGDAGGEALGAAGLRRASVCGSFLHLIDEA